MRASASFDLDITDYKKAIKSSTVIATHPLHGVTITACPLVPAGPTPPLDPLILQSLQQITSSLRKMGAMMEGILTHSSKESEIKNPVRAKLDSQMKLIFLHLDTKYGYTWEPELSKTLKELLAKTSTP